METQRKTAIFRKAAAAAGMAAAILVGSMFPEADKMQEAPAAPPVNNNQVAAYSSRVAYFDRMTSRKAGLDEYQMPVAVTSLRTEDPVSADVTEQKTETVQAAAPASTVPTAESFSVSVPKDTVTAADVRPEKLGLTNTRSTSYEFYTVNDIRTGKKVTLNAHELVCRMVYSEIGASWSEEAIKAQAVAAYTNLRFNDAIGAIPTVGMISSYPAKIEKCVSAVEGQCVFYNGSIINAVYFASAAGYTADCYNVIGISYPYLKPVVSAYDSQDPNYGVVTRFSAAQIKSKLEAKLGFKLSNDLKNWFSIGAVHGGKYVKTLVIDGGKARMSGEAARWLFGLKSSAFEITYSNGVFSFKTYGYGHGIGMPQWGAKLYADNGYTYDQILRHYYLNTEVKVSQPSVKAMKRGNMSTAELEKEIKASSVAQADKYGSNPANDIVVDQQAIKDAEKAAADKEAAEKAAAEKAAAEKAAQENEKKSEQTEQPADGDNADGNADQSADADTADNNTQGE